MADSYRTFAVVNPRSANGSTYRRWSDIARRIEASVGVFQHAFTERAFHAPELARKALEAGYEMIVSVGGDGTHNEVANAFFREDGKPVRPGAVLGLISQGTGCDLVKTLKIPMGYEEAARVLAGKATRTIDVGRTEFSSANGERRIRYFVNITDFGLGGLVIDKVNKTTKAFGGRLSFLLGTVRGLIAYENQPMRIELDGKEVVEGKFQGVVVANGKFFGGGMKIAPQAEPDDGAFDVIFMGDIGFAENLKFTRAIYQGRMESSPKVFRRTARKISATAPETVYIDMDGEGPGVLPITIELLPKALSVKVAG
ncbi:MAG: diacylglycerol kinase family protein [Bdellovibrionota bacterium]